MSDWKTPGFKAFYANYPRKKDPRTAFRAYVAALKRCPDLTEDDLAWAAGQYSEQCKRESKEERYIKYPATWLNAESFDEFFKGD